MVLDHTTGSAQQSGLQEPGPHNQVALGVDDDLDRHRALVSGRQSCEWGDSATICGPAAAYTWMKPGAAMRQILTLMPICGY